MLTAKPGSLYNIGTTEQAASTGQLPCTGLLVLSYMRNTVSQAAAATRQLTAQQLHTQAVSCIYCTACTPNPTFVLTDRPPVCTNKL